MLKINIEALNFINNAYFSNDNLLFYGIAFEYHNGEYSETFIMGGKIIGPQRTWYPNGVLKEEEHRHLSSRHGVYWEWYENGVIKTEAIYEYNIKTKEYVYDITGNLISYYEIDKLSSLYSTLESYRKIRLSSGNFI